MNTKFFFSFSKLLLRICEPHYFTPAGICIAFSTLNGPPFVPSSFRVIASLGSSLDNSGRFSNRARLSPIPLCSFSLPTIGEERVDRVGWFIHESSLDLET